MLEYRFDHLLEVPGRRFLTDQGSHGCACDALQVDGCKSYTCIDGLQHAMSSCFYGL
jgi:hypothetical protein